MRSIPVITYHHVNCHLGDTVTVTPEYFEEQMRYLNERGYKTIFLEEQISFFEQKEVLPERTVGLTIDDGYFDNWLYPERDLRYGNYLFFCSKLGGGVGDTAHPAAGVNYDKQSEFCYRCL